MFDSGPKGSPAADVDDAGDGLLELGRPGHKPTGHYVDDAGNVLELQDVDGAGGAAAAHVDGGALQAADGSSGDGAAMLAGDAGDVPLEPTDAGVAPVVDAGDVDASTPTEPQLCTDTCIDGTFKCPSASSTSGYVCRSWPPCYCTPDGGT